MNLKQKVNQDRKIKSDAKYPILYKCFKDSNCSVRFSYTGTKHHFGESL